MTTTGKWHTAELRGSIQRNREMYELFKVFSNSRKEPRHALVVAVALILELALQPGKSDGIPRLLVSQEREAIFALIK